jgi:hypothetical protein
VKWKVRSDSSKSISDCRSICFFVVFSEILVLVLGTTRSIPSVSAFLFSINNFANKPPFKMNVNELHIYQALYNDNKKGPVFGPDLQIGFEEHLKVQRYSISRELGTAYELPQGLDPSSADTQNLFTGSPEFSLDDLEVFYYEGKY